MVKICEKLHDLNKLLDKRSKICHLDPFLSGGEVTHGGERLEKSFLNNYWKHPILLPKIEKIIDLLMKHYHKLAGHSGHGITLNQIRSLGY